MSKTKRGLIFIASCLAGCVICVFVGGDIINWHYLHDDPHPSASDYSAVGIMMLFFLAPEAVLGLVLGWAGASLGLRWQEATARRKRLEVLLEQRRSRVGIGQGVWPPQPTRWPEP